MLDHQRLTSFEKGRWMWSTSVSVWKFCNKRPCFCIYYRPFFAFQIYPSSLIIVCLFSSSSSAFCSAFVPTSFSLFSARLFVYCFSEAIATRDSSHERRYQHFSWWLLAKKGKIRLQYFSCSLIRRRKFSPSHPQRRGEERESITSPGCFAVLWLISSSWWLSLICYWHHLQSAGCGAR